MKSVLIDGLLIDKYSAGIGHYGFDLISSLKKQNTRYEIAVLVQDGQIFNDIKTVTRNSKSPKKRILNQQLLLLPEFHKYDLIHFIDYSSPIVKIQKPFIVTIHDLSFYKFPETFTFGSRLIKRMITPLSINRASKIITVSENTKKDILSMFKVDEEKIKIIYPGRPGYERVDDKNRIKRVKEKYNIHGDYILYLGTLEPRKNLLRLIDAYNNLVKEGIEEKLVIAGKKGWLYKDIYTKVTQLNLNGKVIFTDFVAEEDKPCLYSGAKVFVYPSLYEGFGLPPLEAMTCGTPVIVSNDSSLPEVVGKSGICVDPYKIHSITQGIYDILKNEELKRKLAAEGKKRSELFDWDKAALNIIQIYDELLRCN